VPKVVDHDERRAAVVEATCQVIARAGLEGATMRAIASEAGCSTGLVTHYFHNKDEIILASVSHVFGKARRRASAELEKDGPPLEILEHILLDSLPLNETSLLEWRVWLVFWGRAYINVDLVREQKRAYAERVATIRNLLTKAQTQGTIDSTMDIAATTFETLAVVDGLGIQGVFSPTPTVRRRLRAGIRSYLTSLTVKQPISAAGLPHRHVNNSSPVVERDSSAR
jgi:AcrR family transcriptional regulator